MWTTKTKCNFKSKYKDYNKNAWNISKPVRMNDNLAK